MNWIRKLVLAVGLALTSVTLLIATVPGATAAVLIDAAVDELGGDYVFVALFGAVAVAFLLVAVAWRAVDGLNQTTPPSPEEVQSVPLFGSDFDDAVDGRYGLHERFVSDRPTAVRERVRAVAIVAEMEAANCSRTEAERRVATGAWTDDGEAAAFLSDETGPDPPLTARVRAALRGRAWSQRGARRAAETAVQRAGVTNDR